MRMRHTTALRRMTVAALVSAATLLAGCKEVTVPNYNAPNVDGLLNNPDAGTVNTAVVGLLVGARRGRWAPSGRRWGSLGARCTTWTRPMPASCSAGSWNR